MEARKPDRRIKRTRRLLQDALITLILKKDYDKITVQDIIDEADVGRSTFYAHYLDKDDLMKNSADMLRAEIGRHFAGMDTGNASDVMLPSLALFRHARGQHTLYKAMLGGRGIEIVIQAVQEGLEAHARAHFEQAERSGKRLTVPIEVLLTHLSGSLQTLLTWWLDNNMPYSPEEMNEMFMQLVRGGVGSVVEDG